MSLLPSGKRFPTSEKSGTSFSTGSPARKPANGSGSLVTSDRILTRKEELRESMSQNPSPLPSLSPVQVPRPVLTSSNSGDSPPPRSEPVASVALPDLATMTTTPSPDVSKLSSFLTKRAGIPKDVLRAVSSPATAVLKSIPVIGQAYSAGEAINRMIGGGGGGRPGGGSNDVGGFGLPGIMGNPAVATSAAFAVASRLSMADARRGITSTRPSCTTGPTRGACA